MSYYRGDYYRGDYYRGDLGGFFRKAVGVVGGAAKGFILGGGPVGAITGAVSALRAKTPSNASQMSVAGTMGIGGTILRAGAKVLPPLLAGKEIFDVVRQFNPFGGGGGGGRRRSMNHLNPKALSRATRRVEGFVKKARKAVSPLGYTVVRRGSARCAPKRKCR